MQEGLALIYPQGEPSAENKLGIDWHSISSEDCRQTLKDQLVRNMNQQNSSKQLQVGQHNLQRKPVDALPLMAIA